MSKKIKIIGILLLVVVAALFISPSILMGYNPISKLTCQNNGDQYRKILGPPGVMTKYYCVHTFADAGKTCQSSDQCEGDCLNIDWRDTKVQDHGVCESDNAPITGCYPGTFDGEKIGFCF